MGDDVIRDDGDEMLGGDFKDRKKPEEREDLRGFEEEGDSGENGEEEEDDVEEEEEEEW